MTKQQKGRRVSIDDMYNNKKLSDYKEFDTETKIAKELRKKTKQVFKDGRNNKKSNI